jgi:hypothetical protein
MPTLVVSVPDGVSVTVSSVGDGILGSEKDRHGRYFLVVQLEIVEFVPFSATTPGHASQMMP